MNRDNNLSQSAEDLIENNETSSPTLNVLGVSGSNNNNINNSNRTFSNPVATNTMMMPNNNNNNRAVSTQPQFVSQQKMEQQSTIQKQTVTTLPKAPNTSGLVQPNLNSFFAPKSGSTTTSNTTINNIAKNKKTPIDCSSNAVKALRALVNSLKNDHEYYMSAINLLAAETTKTLVVKFELPLIKLFPSQITIPKVESDYLTTWVRTRTRPTAIKTGGGTGRDEFLFFARLAYEAGEFPKKKPSPKRQQHAAMAATAQQQFLSRR